MEDLPGRRSKKKLDVLQQAEDVLGQRRELEKINIGSRLLWWMWQAYEPTLAIPSLVWESLRQPRERKSGLLGLFSPLPMPYKQAQPGWSPPHPDSCRAPGSDAAKEAGRAKLFNFQGFLS